MRLVNRFLLLLLILAFHLVVTTTGEADQLAPSDKAITVDQIKTRTSLRLARKSDEGEDSIDTEERAGTGAVSSLKSKISDKIPLSVKGWWWKNFSSKSLESLEQKLGANHPLYLAIKAKRLENELWAKAGNGYSTFKYWKDMGLDQTVKQVSVKASTKDLAALFEGLERSASFRQYRQYAKEFDQRRLDNFSSGYNRDTVFIDKDASVVERFARAHFWAEEKVPAQYAAEFLGRLHWRPGQLKDNPYFKYYLNMYKTVHGKRAY